MTTPDQPNTSARTIDRRKVVGGLAWSVPTVAVATAAPAMAVSPGEDIRDRGLQGWVELSKECYPNSPARLTIDGTGSFPDRGLWVLDTLEDDDIQDVYIVFYFSSTLGRLNWDATGPNSGWSVPQPDASVPQIAGYTAYVTRYTGTFTFRDRGRNPDYHWANGQPRFSATVSGCPTVESYARRSVTVNDEQITFIRGPITLR